MAFIRRTRPARSASDRRAKLRHALLGAAALLLMAAGDASAQFAYGYMRTYPGPVFADDLAPVPPRAVVYRLQDRGFTEITRPRFDGRAYVVEATNPMGNRVRLFVDARGGAVIGRERLDTPYYPSGRVARAAPGYGWTEEDAAPRRAGRDPEALVPPGDIPLPRPSLRTEIDRAPGSPPPATSGDAPFGVNPDARAGARGDKARAATAPRKTAKLTSPVRPPAPRTAPEAPVPPTTSGEAAAPSVAAPDVAKAAPAPTIPDAAGASVKVVEPPTPAAHQPAKAAEIPSDVKQAEKAPAAGGSPNRGWQDPPAADQKRNVRVIGGAIVVPGSEPSPAN